MENALSFVARRLIIITIFIAPFFYLAGTANAALVLGPSQTYNGHSYAVIYNDLDDSDEETWSGLTRTDAEDFAVSQGGHLVTINDASENSWLHEGSGLIDEGTVYWIGLYYGGTGDYWNDPSGWTWSSGEDSPYRNWRQTTPNAQPDQGNLEDIYAVINYEDYSTWDNYPSDPTQHPYNLALPKAIVEFVPIPAAVWLLGGGLIGLVALRRRKG